MSVDRVNHFIVLMLENRSFDHMLGYLKEQQPSLDGLTGDETNPDTDGQPVKVEPSADYQGVLDPDPGHDARSVFTQLCSKPAICTDGKNDGFVRSYSRKAGSTPANIMRCFAPDRLPALATLAQQFGVCDQWFAPVPGPTIPNRLFAHAATSDGFVDNKVRLYRMKTIYDSLAEAGVSWKLYYHDFPHALFLSRLQDEPFKGRFRKFDHFLEDARTGALPSYSFLEPRYFNFLWRKANDQHPDHDVQQGEQLITDVYTALRHSPQWNESLLIITYDEHGGLYDHVFPPPTVNPDGKHSRDPEFHFDRLGVRVPAVFVSPLISAGTILRSTDERRFDHTSILATLEHKFGLPSLTKRDKHAPLVDSVITLTAPRTDTVVLPGQVAPVERMLTADNVERALAQGEASPAPLTDFQESLVALAKTISTPQRVEARAVRAARLLNTEHDAAQFVRESAEDFFHN